VEHGKPPEAGGERNDRQREVEPVGARSREPERGEAEDHRAQAHSATRPEARSDQEREERGREDRRRGDTEVRVRSAEERQLEGRAERAEICEQKEEPDDPEGHLADHARESIAWPQPSG
jgi:hypothetical protein